MNATTSTNIDRAEVTFCGAARLGYAYLCNEMPGHKGDHRFISPVSGVTNTWPHSDYPWYAPLAPAEARELHDVLIRGYRKVCKLERYNERRQAWDFDLLHTGTEVFDVATDLIRVV